MLTPDQLAEIEAADLHSLQADAPHNPDVWTLNEWRTQLLAEVKRLHNELEAAEEDSAKLRILEAAGVDNWGGYEHAMELLNEGEGSC